MPDDLPEKPSRIGCLLKGCGALVALGALAVGLAVAGAWFAFSSNLYEGVPPRKTPLVIRGGTLLDGTGAKPAQGIVLVIEGDRITCASRKCGIPASAEVIDAAGMTVMPGLIDTHVHLLAAHTRDASGSGPAATWDLMRWRPAIRRSLLEAGITTIRSVGDPPGPILGLRERHALGELRGPRIFTSGPVFTAPGGFPKGKLDHDAIIEVTNTDQARSEVVRVVAAGVDSIKIVYDDGEGKVPKITEDVLAALVSEAHNHGMKVAIHAGSAADMRNAAVAGADTIEHIARDEMGEGTLKLLAERNVTVVPTLARIEAVTPTLLDRAKANVHAAYAHDPPIALGVGSDPHGGGMAFGHSLARELELWVDAGIDPLVALTAATSGNARILGQTDTLGTLQEGRRADVVLVRGRPHETIAEVRNVAVVVQDGRIVVDKR